MEKVVQISEGSTMSAAAALPALVLKAITVVGISCTLVAFTIKRSFCANEFLSFSNSPMAFTAYGVAAPMCLFCKPIRSNGFPI